MDYKLKLTRISDGKTKVKTFRSKKEVQRFQMNNYAEYTWETPATSKRLYKAQT